MLHDNDLATSLVKNVYIIQDTFNQAQKPNKWLQTLIEQFSVDLKELQQEELSVNNALSGLNENLNSIMHSKQQISVESLSLLGILNEFIENAAALEIDEQDIDSMQDIFSKIPYFIAQEDNSDSINHQEKISMYGKIMQRLHETIINSMPDTYADIKHTITAQAKQIVQLREQLTERIKEQQEQIAMLQKIDTWREKLEIRQNKVEDGLQRLIK